MRKSSSFSFYRQLFCVAVASILANAPCAAWANAEDPLSFFLAGAYPFAVGTTHQWTNGEYGILGGFAYKEAQWPVGLQMEGMTYRFGFNDHANSFTNSDGYMQMTGGTANITWVPPHFEHSHAKPKLITGIGVYNRVIRTTETRLIAGTCFDPWWGYYPCTGNGTVVTNSNSQTKFGVNVGGSMNFELLSATEFFVELRFHEVFTSHKETPFMPINVGIRW